MRAVVDTNIFVSSLISPAGPPAQVLVAFEERRFTLISSKPLLQELETVLGRAKFHRRGITPERTRTMLGRLQEAAELVEIPGTLQLCRDRRDDMLIETALQGSADVIVSRDEDLTRALEVIDYLAPWGIRVLTVRRFLEVLAEP